MDIKITRKGLWKGKPLEDYSKEELMDIIIEMHEERVADLWMMRDRTKSIMALYDR